MFRLSRPGRRHASTDRSPCVRIAVTISCIIDGVAALP
jgi:hypothetical protein